MIIKTTTRLTIIVFFMSIINIQNALSNYDKNFFDFIVKGINGKEINLSIYKGKTIMIVNVASKCGFTKQYKDLQELWKRYKSKGLVVIGFPSNQFGAQEPGNDKDIKNFCEVNYNIDFPMVSKTEVKGENAHEIYKWALINHGKSTVPKWNFHKILINSDGKVEDTYLSFVKPISKKIVNKIEKLLN